MKNVRKSRLKDMQIISAVLMAGNLQKQQLTSFSDLPQSTQLYKNREIRQFDAFNIAYIQSHQCGRRSRLKRDEIEACAVSQLVRQSPAMLAFQMDPSISSSCFMSSPAPY